ncbi:unnamed protein product [Callosobruchus maculatus]|uniref:Uncharacterized protein n=1 Tax=Callosobruchus maculatus TaxID=64391 RepID=A0A653DDY0_CALMS|nr:unnamed protein product [Callosobruchus maculatus]
MFKCTAILLLASAALSAAVPIGTYGGIYGVDRYPLYGNIYDVVKKNQLGDLLELNDKHTLEQMYLMAGQNIVRDVLNEQQEKALENKEVLDRLEQVEQIDMQKQKEKLEMMQWMQKLQLDKVHGIEDVKITGHGYPGELL